VGSTSSPQDSLQTALAHFETRNGVAWAAPVVEAGVTLPSSWWWWRIPVKFAQIYCLFSPKFLLFSSKGKTHVSREQRGALSFFAPQCMAFLGLMSSERAQCLSGEVCQLMASALRLFGCVASLRY
jgi:hypothetical protein